MNKINLKTPVLLQTHSLGILNFVIFSATDEKSTQMEQK